MRPNVTSTIAKAVRNSLVWRHGVGRCFCWSSAEEAQCTGLRQPWLRRAVLPKCRGVWLSVKRLGNQCQCCAIYCRWFCAYAEDRDRKRSLTPLSPEKGLHVCCSQVGTLSKTNNLPLWISGIFQIIVFMLSTSRLFFCLLSRSSEMPSRLLKLLALGLWCGQGPCWSSWGKCQNAGTEGRLTEKGGCTTMQCGGTWSKLARQPLSGFAILCRWLCQW